MLPLHYLRERKPLRCKLHSTKLRDTLCPNYPGLAETPTYGSQTRSRIGCWKRCRNFQRPSATLTLRTMIIQGDNLDALKALLPVYAGQVKCVFIDPPYNTRSAFEQYDDNLEHSNVRLFPTNAPNDHRCRRTGDGRCGK